MPPGPPWYSTTDFYYHLVIAAMSVTIVVMWIEFRRIKNKSRQRGRRMSELITDPAEVRWFYVVKVEQNFSKLSLKMQVRDHLTDTIKEVAEFVVPRKEKRFRKRDRFYFHSRRFVRKVT